ncbi:antibiotic biosynthesis monooxygenase [Candidatus Poribacteria bacterium]|nr:antibiotic biosynthesis monooxygenase [Candidatus Poribacteria bacterium]
MFVVSNRIHVAEGYESEFEARFSRRLGAIEGTPGFVRYLLLKPVKATHYVVNVYWENREAFESWVGSESFRKAHADRPPEAMFAGPNQVEQHEVIQQSGAPS